MAPGEVIGEMGMITEDTRSAEIMAIRDSHLIEIMREDFKKLYYNFPGFGWKLSKLIISRGKSERSNRNLRKVKNVAVVALHPGN